MHKILKAALPNATGHSEFVIVVVADIRGFSAFSRQHESPDIAMYVKRVYMKLIDAYFPAASFYKTTGDGLLATVPYDEKTLSETANQTLESCLRCVDEFGSICQDDAMVNFPTPNLVGFGLTRGTACCLASADMVLDYSGHLLNLATRLMGLARPSGIVLDGAFGTQLLKTDTQALFEAAEVYLRGLAEDKPVKVFYQKGKVEIPEDAKRPLATQRWNTWSETRKLHEWRKVGQLHRLSKTGLSRRPVSAVLSATYPAKAAGKILKGVTATTIFSSQLSYYELAGKVYPSIDTWSLVDHLKSRGVSSKSAVTLTIDFVPPD
jgi:class 3 adenylate cyclase